MRPALLVLLLLVLAVVASSCGGDTVSGNDAGGTPGASPSRGETTNGAGVPEGEEPEPEFGPGVPNIICLDDEGNRRPCTREEVEDILRERSQGSPGAHENAGGAGAETEGSGEDVTDEDPDASLGPAEPNIICRDAEGNRRPCTQEEIDEILRGRGREPADQRRPSGGGVEDAQETEDPAADAEDVPPDDQDGGAEPVDEDDDAPAVEDETAPEADGP